MKYDASNFKLNEQLKCDQLDENTYLIFNQSENAYHTLNSTAKFILDYCAENSTDNILQAVKEQFNISGVSDEELGTDIEKIIDDFCLKKLIFVAEAALE